MLDAIYYSLNPIAFTLGPVVVRWYGLAYFLGFALAAFVIYRIARRWKVQMSGDDLLTIVCCVIVGVLVGARVGYVLVYGAGQYTRDPMQIFMVQNGGMSFHGGLIGALLAGIVAAKITKIPYLTLTDMAVCGAPLGLLFGRIANFINGELWGAPTSAPWGVVFGGAAGYVPREPSQLYEAFLEGIVIFVVLFALSRKTPPRPRGTFLSLFLIMYGTFRFLVEFVRQPDAQIGYLAGGWLTMGQVLSVPLVIAGIVILVYTVRTRLPQQGVQVN